MTVDFPGAPGVQTHPWHHTRHHNGDGRPGFHNIWGEEQEPSLLKGIGWLIKHGWQPGAHEPIPFRRIDPAALGVPVEKAAVFWIGQSTCLIRTPAHVMLTDPVFSSRASPFSFMGPARRVALPLTPAEVPPVDTVLISHNHYDHLDKASVQALAGRFQPLFLVPPGLGGLLASWGARRVVELDWWQFVEARGLRFHATPAKHFSSRSAFDRDATLWTSWFIEDAARGLRIFYGADSAYADHFREIRTNLGAPNAALLPVGAYEPRWFMKRVHMNPEESVQAFVDLEAGHFIAIHWGTFDLAEEPLHVPGPLTRQIALQRGLDPERVHVLPVGGEVWL